MGLGYRRGGNQRGAEVQAMTEPLADGLHASVVSDALLGPSLFAWGNRRNAMTAGKVRSTYR